MSSPAAALDQYGMIGSSQPMREVYALLGKIAPMNVTVLITGESGTGKELVAQALHNYHPTRASAEYIAFNCAATPVELFESELFGHERGAYTGAVHARDGLVIDCTNGTLFLDEIGETPLAVQGKLLRVIGEHEVTKLGMSRVRKVNTRFVTATNRNLKEEIQKETFRADLYHRINVIEINMPALRERREDIPLLGQHFLSYFALKHDMNPLTLSSDSAKYLQQLDWPGNVRELRNLMERTTVLHPKEQETSPNGLEHLYNMCNYIRELPGDLPIHTPSVDYVRALNRSRLEMVRHQTKHMLEKYHWNKVRTAEALGITRKTLVTDIKKFELDNLE